MSYVQFKGTDSEYHSLHQWIKSVRGKPSKCEICGIENVRLEWANISGDYKKDETDWEQLCKVCHARKDLVGAISTCKRGHQLTAENLYIPPNKGRCRECRMCRKNKHSISNPISNKNRSSTPPAMEGKT